MIIYSHVCINVLTGPGMEKALFIMILALSLTTNWSIVAEANLLSNADFEQKELNYLSAFKFYAHRANK